MLIANASIINRPLDGRKSSHPFPVHKIKALSRTGRLPPTEEETSGTCPYGRWEAPFPELGGAGCGSETGMDKDIKIPRHQLPGVEKEPNIRALAGGPFSRSKPRPPDVVCLGGECAADSSKAA